MSEIAEITGTDVGVIKSRLYRARERLKGMLRPYLGGDRELNNSREIVSLKEA
jgi:DNA-directed RNA polymerase specialized sigma24 family protein